MNDYLEIMARQTKLRNREEWLEERRGGIGGSDAAPVLGASRWKGPLAVYVEKLGIAQEDKDTRFTRWGRLLEEAVAMAYEEETGRGLVNPGTFTITRHREVPHLFATLDRLIESKRGIGVLQIKTTSWGFLEEWQEDPPLEAQVQLQHEMAVVGATWGSLAVLIAGREFRWVDVELNQGFVDAMIEKETAFWRRVQDREPPGPDNLVETARALRALYPKDSGETVALPAEAIEWHRDLDEAKRRMKEWEGRKVEAENRIKGAMGEATFGVLMDGGRYSWKMSDRKGYEVKPTTVRALRYLEK